MGHANRGASSAPSSSRASPAPAPVESAAPSCAPAASASRLRCRRGARDWVRDIDVGGRTLSVACVGPTDTGRPTVIFESGLGGDRACGPTS